ncbi:MAG: hypothetical protein L6R35_003332 [Caloplaca aegaea]|nr:MAG: hypothetical protein L6R35_003332 [Caloplaca aegaea]
MGKLKAQSALEMGVNIERVTRVRGRGAYESLEERNYNQQNEEQHRLEKEQKRSQAEELKSESGYLPQECRCQGHLADDFCPENLQSPTGSADDWEAVYQDSRQAKLTDMVIDEGEPSKRLSGDALHRWWLQDSDDEFYLEDLPYNWRTDKLIKFSRRQLRMPMPGNEDRVRSNLHISSTIEPQPAVPSKLSNVPDRNKKRGRESDELEGVKRRRLTPEHERVLHSYQVTGDIWLSGNNPISMTATPPNKKRNREEQDAGPSKRGRLGPEADDTFNSISALDGQSRAELPVNHFKIDAGGSRSPSLHQEVTETPQFGHEMRQVSHGAGKGPLHQEVPETPQQEREGKQPIHRSAAARQRHRERRQRSPTHPTIASPAIVDPEPQAALAIDTSVASTQPASTRPPKQNSSGNGECQGPTKGERSQANSRITRPPFTQDKASMKKTNARNNRGRKQPWFIRFVEQPRQTRSHGSQTFYELGERGRDLNCDLRPSQWISRS